MKITHNKVGQNLNTTDAKSEKASGAASTAAAKKSSATSSAKETGEAASGAQAAKVELSPKAQDIKKIKELAMNSPDVDANKVEKFKRMIADGTYKVDAKAVADRMVDEQLRGLGKSSNE